MATDCGWFRNQRISRNKLSPRSPTEIEKYSEGTWSSIDTAAEVTNGDRPRSNLRANLRRSKVMANPFDLRTALLAKHAQHVVLIHFPIALFITAVLFDLIGQWTKRRGIADAAYFNLLVAAIST